MNFDSICQVMNDIGMDGIMLNAPTPDDYRVAIPIAHKPVSYTHLLGTIPLYTILISLAIMPTWKPLPPSAKRSPVMPSMSSGFVP